MVWLERVAGSGFRRRWLLGRWDRTDNCRGGSHRENLTMGLLAIEDMNQVFGEVLTSLRV